MTERVLGTDTSHWSSKIDFYKMYDAGAKFWITKATDAYISSPFQYEDSKFMEFSKAAIAHGKLLTGCFHWLQASIDPKVAADFYLERYNRFHFDFPPILDFEEANVIKTKKFSDYAWRAQVWLEYVNEKTAKLPIIYTGKWYTDYFKPEYLSWMKEYPLWVADYTWKSNNVFKKPFYMPKPWTKQAIWQFSADGNNRGREFGANADDIDLNWFEGSYDDLLKFIGATDITHPVPPEPPVIEPISGSVFEVIGAIQNVRVGPGMGFEVRTTLKRGATLVNMKDVQVISADEIWLEFEIGWIALVYAGKLYLKDR